MGSSSVGRLRSVELNRRAAFRGCSKSWLAAARGVPDLGEVVFGSLQAAFGR